MLKSNKNIPTKQYAKCLSDSKYFHPFILIFYYCKLIHNRMPTYMYPLIAEKHISFIQQKLLHNDSVAQINHQLYCILLCSNTQLSTKYFLVSLRINWRLEYHFINHFHLKKVWIWSVDRWKKSSRFISFSFVNDYFQ